MCNCEIEKVLKEERGTILYTNIFAGFKYLNTVFYENIAKNEDCFKN